MTIDLSKLIDERNQSLWEEICLNYHVEVAESKNSEYACFTESNYVTFYIPPNNYCPDSFTHELLHVYIRLKEVYIGANLIHKISASNILRRFFVDALLEHISNSLDHIKMLPIYLEMGFRRDKFLLDYNEYKCTDKELADIKKFYKIGRRLNVQAIEFYIGKIFAIKADPNTDFDYSNCLIQLNRIDGKLYQVLVDFISSWENYDINKEDIFNSYRHLVDKLYEGLKNWMNGKEFS